jgi:hypothetical protein
MRNILWHFLLLILFKWTKCTNHIFYTKHQHDTIREHGSTKKTNIASNLILCGPIECQIIKKFSISENNTFDCREDVLLINFEFTMTFRNLTKVTQQSFGYINKDNNLITDRIETSSCKIIKKYFNLFNFNIIYINIYYLHALIDSM